MSLAGNAHRARPLRVALFGDSVCVGQRVSPHLTWATRLSARLSELAEAHGREVELTNPSVNGETTRRALERMPHDVQDFEPDLLLIQFGMNDCNYWQTDQGVQRVSPRAFTANLHEMIDRGYAFGTQTVILHTNHPTARTRSPLAHSGITYEQSNEQYNDLIRSVAAEREGDVILNDIGTAWEARVEGDEPGLLKLVLPDLLHLSPDGHELYFELVEPVFREALEALLGRNVGVA